MMKYTNRIFGTFLFSLMTCFFAYGQTVVYEQNFENPAFADWDLNTVIPSLGSFGPESNIFVVNDVYAGFPGMGILDTDDQPIAINNSPNGSYLHVLSVAAQDQGILNCNYLDVAFSGFFGDIITVETPDISTIGYTDVTLDFWWLCGNAGFVWFGNPGGQIFYSVDQGGTWLNVPGVGLFNSSTWNQEIINNPVFDNQPNIRFAFSFNADMGGLESLGFALDDFKVLGDPVCDVNLGPSVSVCYGDSITIDAGEGFDNYLWSTGETTQMVTLDTLSQGFLDTFWVLVDSVGCAATDSVEIWFNSEVEIDNIIISNTSGCSLTNGSVQYTATGGTPFNTTWNPPTNEYTAFLGGMVNDTTDIISGLELGIYDLIVNDSLGCFSDTVILIEENVNSIVINSIVADVDCSSYGSIIVDAFNFNNGQDLYYSIDGGVTYEDNGGTFGGLNMGGPYQVWVTDSNCTVFDTTNYFLSTPEINITNITVKDVDCFGTNDAYIEVDVIGGSGNYQVQLDGGTWYTDVTSTITIPNVGAGVYDIVAQDLSSLCTDILLDEPVTQPGAGLQIVVSVVDAVNGVGIPCSGDCSGELIVEVIGGTPFPDGSYVVDWQDDLGNSLFNDTEEELSIPYTSNVLDICEGTYFVSVFDAICPNPATGAITITANTPITLLDPNMSSDSVSCFNGSDGSLLAEPSGGVPPYEYDWGSYGSTQGISDLSIGTYTVNITDAEGCPASFSSQIVQPNELIVDANIISEISCYGESDGILEANVYGGTGSYSFVWSHPSFPWVDDQENNYTSNSTEQYLDSLPPSVLADDIALNPDYQSYSYPYLITVEDWNDCVSTSEIFLVEPPKLDVFLTQATHPAYCDNSDPGLNTGWAEVTASGGTPNINDNYTFQWSALAQNDSDVLYSSIDNVTAGTYSVVVIDDRLCADTAEIVIDLESTWLAYTASTDASCYMVNDGSVSIQMEGGCGDPDNSCAFNYLWNGGGATGNTLPDVNNLQQGNYSVIVSDDWGCEAVYTVVVNGPDLVEFQINSLEHQSCYSNIGASEDGVVEVEVWGGHAPYDVSWTEGSTSVIVGTGQTSGVYQITGLSADNWTVDVVDSNNCIGVFNLSSLNPNPFDIYDGIEVTASIDPAELFLTEVIDCFQDETGEARVLNPNPNFDYTWFVDGNTNVIDQGTSTVFLPAGDIVVQASYLLGLCTAISTPVTILEQPPFSVLDNSVMPACFGDGNAVIDLVITGATPHLNNDQPEDYDFTWSPGNLNGLGVVNEDGYLEINIPNQSAGTYYLEVVDKFGCDTVYTVEIVDPNHITLQITPTDLTCNENNTAADGIIQIDAVGGVGPYDFFLGNGDVINNVVSDAFTNLSPNTYNISAEDANGCSSLVTPITISQPPELTVDIIPELILDVTCNGADDGQFQINGQGGTQPYVVYSINGPVTSNNNLGAFTGLAPGNYTFTVQDANGCTATGSQIITEPSELNTPILLADSVSCFGLEDGSIDLDFSSIAGSGTPPYTYLWSNGDNTEDLEYVTAGYYSVSLVDANNCEQVADAIIGEPEEVQADWLIVSPGTYNNETVLSQAAPLAISFIDTSLNSDHNLTEWWINGENQTANFYGSSSSGDIQEYLFMEMGDYEVVMYAYNIYGCWDTISIDVTVQGLKEFDVFTPNGDDVNDYFFFENYGMSELNAVFYNRWGDKIYELDTPEGKWDGVSMNGQEVPEGVYFYVLSAKGEDGSQYSEKGSVTLYR